MSTTNFTATTVEKTTESETATKTARKTAKPSTAASKTAKSPKTTTKSKPTTASGKVPKAKAVKPTVVTETSAVPLGPAMRKKELIERVVARSGIKKKSVKPVLEAVLAELGEALADDRELVLPPFGKAKINRKKMLAKGRIIIVKLRQSLVSPKQQTEAAE